MNIRNLAILGALACAGLVAAPAIANDGGGEPAKNEPASKQGDKPVGDAGKECKDAPAGKDGKCEGAGAAKKATSPCGGAPSDCVPTCEGPADGSDLCAEGTAKRSAFFVTLAAAVGDDETAKKVLGAVPAEAAKKVEEARKAAFETAVKVRRELNGLKAEIEGICAQAKADGKEVCAEAVQVLMNDAKTLKVKCHESMDSFAKVLGESLGAEKVQALGAEVQKAGDVVKAFTAKVEAAAKAAEIEAAAKAKAAEAEAEKDEAPAKDGAPAKEPCKTGGG